MVVMGVTVDTSHFRLQPNVHVNFSVMAVMVHYSHFRLQPNDRSICSVMAVMTVMVVTI